MLLWDRIIRHGGDEMSLWWKIAAWLQLAWPFTLKLIMIISDGRVTREELVQLIDGLLKGKSTNSSSKRRDRAWAMSSVLGVVGMSRSVKSFDGESHTRSFG